ncbi:MAG: hypothetical protein U1E14_06700 [Geminicoccaceae bacterium]
MRRGDGAGAGWRTRRGGLEDGGDQVLLEHPLEAGLAEPRRVGQQLGEGSGEAAADRREVGDCRGRAPVRRLLQPSPSQVRQAASKRASSIDRTKLSQRPRCG